jgi:hypothetical protein
MTARHLPLLVLSAVGALALAMPAAASKTDALSAAFNGAPLSDAAMSDLRGGLGFLSALPTGSTVKINIGGTTVDSHQEGDTSAASASLSGGGTVASGSSSIGVGGANSFAVARTINTTTSVARSSGFSFSF